MHPTEAGREAPAPQRVHVEFINGSHFLRRTRGAETPAPKQKSPSGSSPKGSFLRIVGVMGFELTKRRPEVNGSARRSNGIPAIRTTVVRIHGQCLGAPSVGPILDHRGRTSQSP